MKCHYAVLGVELTADQDEIKKAYRKLALKWHPDKNLHNVDEANENFRLVQAAYDVLSDPQEKAWYDRNREEILHKKLFANYKENSLDLFDYFTPSAYRGYRDDEKGFYYVYRTVFETIDKEDDPFRSSDSDSDDEMPNFGSSDSDYETVVYEFYAAWDAYRTRMSFVWVDKYDKTEAPNRRVMRLIEKENKKERDKHRKKRNDLVHDLVSFVRKRDPRVKAHRQKLEEQVAENKQRAEEQRLANMRAKVQKAADYEQANKEKIQEHHEQVAQLENLMKSEFGFTSSEESASEKSDGENKNGYLSEEEEYEDELYCVACNKQFKTKMAKRNHEKSKKHKEKVNMLKEELRNEEELNEDGLHDDEVEEDVEDYKKLSKKQKKQKKQQSKRLNNSMSAQPFVKSDFDSPSTEVRTESVRVSNEEILEKESKIESNKRNVKKKRRKQKHMQAEPPVSDGNKETHLDNTSKETLDKLENTSSNHNGEEYTIIESDNVELNPTTKLFNENTGSSDITNSFVCQICCSSFGTRNKLFKHIKSTGHAVAFENGQQQSNSKKGKRKTKR